MEWAKIHISKNEIEANMIKGLLESGGLRVVISPGNDSHIYSGAATQLWVVYVPRDQAERAKEILKESNL